MGIFDTIGRAFMEGYATSELDITTMFLCVGLTSLIALYICIVYRLTNKNSFYDRSFHLSLFGLAVITSTVILTIQSNIVISLGMVGALSIVRFRTAIKNPMDLVFLFWSISAGIICGAGFVMIAVIGSIALTMGIVLFDVLPGDRESMVLVVNTDRHIEEGVVEVVERNSRSWRIRAWNVGANDANLAIEVRTDHPRRLVREVADLSHVTSVSLVDHNGDVTA